MRSRLDDLLPRGTKLADAPVGAKGLPMALWRKLMMDEMFAASYKIALGSEAPLSKQRVWSPRDSYGMKSV